MLIQAAASERKKKETSGTRVPRQLLTVSKMWVCVQSCSTIALFMDYRTGDILGLRVPCVPCIKNSSGSRQK